MNFPVFHGIKLAKNAYIENAILEQLALDPTVLDSAGRLFFNLPEKRFKATTINGSGQVSITTFAELSDLSAISGSVTNLTNALAASTGTDMIGYSGHTQGTVVIPAGTLTSTLNAIVLSIKTSNDAISSLETRLASTTTTQGSALVGFSGHTTTTLTVAAGDVRASLISIINAINTNRVDFNTLNTGLPNNYVSKTLTTAQTILSDFVINQNLTVKGNLLLEGGTFTVQSETVTIADNIIELNSNVVSGTPTENAGVAVSRGDQGSLTFIHWNEASDRVEIPVWTGSLFEQRPIATENYVQSQVTSGSNTLRTDLAATTTAKGAEMVGYAGHTVGGINIPSGTVDSALDALVDRINTVSNSTVSNATITNITNSVGLAADGTIASFSNNFLTGAITIRQGLISLDAQVKTNQTNIANEVTRATNAEGAITSSVNTLRTNTQSAVNGLVSEYNSSTYTLDTPTAALSHTITHNLNSSFVDVEVWVRDTDNKYRKHIVFIEEVNNNSVLIELTESRRIKVIVRAVKSLNNITIAS